MTTIIESMPSTYSLVKLDCGSFVMPWKEFRASASQLARLSMATLMSSIAAPLLGDVEAEMAKEARRRSKIPEGRAIRAGADVDILHGPLDLVPAKALGLPLIRDDEGPKYQPDPYWSREPVRAPVMDKFDRREARTDEGVLLRRSGLTDGQLQRLDEADRKLAAADSRLRARATIYGRGRMTQAEREERLFARDAYAALAAEIGAKLERNDMRRALAERRELDRQRGQASRLARMEILRAKRESLEGRRPPLSDAAIGEALGRLQVRLQVQDGLREIIGLDGNWRGGDDGLINLVASGTIILPDCLAGLRYRSLRAASERSLGSAMGERTGKGDDGTYLEMRADALVKLKRLEAAVMAIQNPRALTVLRAVAGEGRTINSIGSKSADRHHNTRALILALRVAREELDRPPAAKRSAL